MKNNLFWNIVIALVVVVSLVYIYPTIGWMTLSEEQRETRLAKWHEEDMAVAEPGFFGDIGHGIRRWSEFNRDSVINLGLDLQGGVHMVVGFDMPDDAAERNLTESDIQELVLQRIGNRIDEFEAQEPVIQKLGRNQVQIQLPGEKDTGRAQQLILKTAYLTFHIVSGPDETSQVLRAIDAHLKNGFVPFLETPVFRGGPVWVKPENFDRISNLVKEALATPGVVPAGKTILFSPPPAPQIVDGGYTLYVTDLEPAVTGEGLSKAMARPDDRNPGQWQIMFEFDGDGATKFAGVTEANKGRGLAIVLDDKVVSAPNINERIYSQGNITGSFTAEESRDLAIALNSGSMPVPVRVDYQGVVEATLGNDSVRNGYISGTISTIVVMLFMVFYYRVAGMVANIALIVNMISIFGALAYFGATLTLPGIAGLILTIGMAMDANVLIYERIREELRLGKSLVSAVEAGFNRAVVTILDSNITTLIAAAVLSQFGTGPIQGFAVTLSIGVVSSVFAGVVVSRAIIDFMVSRKLISTMTMMTIFKQEPQFKFMKKFPPAMTLTAVIIVVGMVVFGLRGENMYGIDFKSGTNMIVAIKSDTEVPVEAVRKGLTGISKDEPVVQAYKEQGADEINKFLIRIGDEGANAPEANPDGTQIETVADRVQAALLPLSGNPDPATADEFVDLLRVETVGPSVGNKLKTDAISALLYALVGVMIYLWFRFEFRYSLAAAVALAHDALFTIAIFAFAGREISLSVVAAILTVIGYSLNDTIVVFDRIREDSRPLRGKGFSFPDIIDICVNRTLNRTLLTSVTTTFTVIILLLFGGGAIFDFALALLIGIVIGTYSSIFIASPIVDIWQRWRLRRDIASDDKKSTPDKKGPGGKKKRTARSEEGEEALA